MRPDLAIARERGGVFLVDPAEGQLESGGQLEGRTHWLSARRSEGDADGTHFGRILLNSALASSSSASFGPFFTFAYRGPSRVRIAVLPTNVSDISALTWKPRLTLEVVDTLAI